MSFSNVNISESAISTKISELWKQSDCTVDIDDDKLKKLTALVMLLFKWNQALNLTAIKDPMDMVVLHILDSMSIEPYIFGKNIADVGTGPGFPGLVLAVLHPEIKFTLIDSVAKKISFVKNAIAILELNNVSAVIGRCEELSPSLAFECIVSRAFAPLERIVSWCRGLITHNGKFVAMKGKLTDAERNDLPEDAVIEEIHELHVPCLNASRQAVIISLKH